MLESHATTADIVSGVRDGVSIYVETRSLVGLTQRGGGWDDDEAYDSVGHWLVRTDCVAAPFPWELFLPAILHRAKQE